ncbi:MAG: PD40 domain-containing protein, partial [Bacteroidia bacterium]|nr:PD40 domain-containing protein [Bacteroidia bacterium]
PDWYYKGLVEYLAESWNITRDNYLKDFFQNQKQRYFTSLQREDEILAGQSIWRYLEEKYDKGAVSNIVFLTKVGKSVENAMIYYTGMNMNQLLNDWQEFYLNKYSYDEKVFKFPKGQENAPAKIAKKQHTQFKLSNDGTKVAIVTNTLGKYQVVIYTFADKHLEVIVNGGHALLNRDINLNYPLIAWTPDGKYLSIIEYSNEHPILKDFDFSGKLIKQTVLANVPFVKEFCYNSQGNQLALSVLRNGQSDLMILDKTTMQTNYISNDVFDNLNPRFSPDDRYLYFVSNKGPQGEESSFYGIYRYEFETQSQNLVLGNQYEKVNLREPIPLENNVVSFLSDRNGILNNYVIDLNENQTYQLTNYKRCILHNDVARDVPVVADLLYFNNRYRVYVGTITKDYANDAIVNAESTAYRKWIEHDINPAWDTLKNRILLDTIPTPIKSDSVGVKKVFLTGFDTKDELPNMDKEGSNKSQALLTLAKTQFGIDYMVQQLDVSILGNYLFPTNIPEKVFNYPFLSYHVQTSISDDLKNHVIVAGVRIPIVKSKASDYYITYNNRKGRWDKEVSVFRRSRTFEESIVPLRMINSMTKLAISYPFSERGRIEFNGFGRNDRVVRLAVDSIELKRAPINNLYFGNGVEYVFDNVRSNGLNLFQGLRFRVYNENYFRTSDGVMMSNNGFDFRYYKKIHRQIYFAYRFSGAASLGSLKTVYYMGGVENWLSNIDSNRTFSYNNPTYTGSAYSDYGFQTITAPARGFYRNARSGNKFLLMNVEIRIPLLSYLVQKPITSDFFRSFMITGFVDIGTAWKGKSPYSIDNPFNTVIVQSPQYYVTVQSQRDPILYGMGFGARAKILGHYLKYDRAWGIFESKFLRPMNTFSIGLDF